MNATQCYVDYLDALENDGDTLEPVIDLIRLRTAGHEPDWGRIARERFERDCDEMFRQTVGERGVW